jgi:hypothetical protein
MADNVMFRGGVDTKSNFRQQDFVFTYKCELLRDKIKRRTLSSMYVKIDSKVNRNSFTNIFYDFFRKRD